MSKKKERPDLNQITIEELCPRIIETQELSVVSNQGKELNVEMMNPVFEIPENVKKNNTRILNEVMNTDVNNILSENGVMLEVEDISYSSLPIKNRIMLSYNDNIIDKLTNFDKEVMDAVATLAPLNNVISATSIFRIISGKMTGTINKNQRDKVDESMERCRKYLLKIDLTSQYLINSPQERKYVDSLEYSGYLISFSKFDKRSKKGGKTGNYYYVITEMPLMFRLAESIGRVSEFPIALLDTPVQKTNQAIVVQGFLLREIDNMKKGLRDSNFLTWEEVYEVAMIEDLLKQQKQRFRKLVESILEFWKEKKFIDSFNVASTGPTKGILIILK